jgi:hypothetical protein
MRLSCLSLVFAFNYATAPPDPRDELDMMRASVRRIRPTELVVASGNREPRVLHIMDVMVEIPVTRVTTSDFGVQAVALERYLRHQRSALKHMSSTGELEAISCTDLCISKASTSVRSLINLYCSGISEESDEEAPFVPVYIPNEFTVELLLSREVASKLPGLVATIQTLCRRSDFAARCTDAAVIGPEFARRLLVEAVVGSGESRDARVMPKTQAKHKLIPSLLRVVEFCQLVNPGRIKLRAA